MPEWEEKRCQETVDRNQLVLEHLPLLKHIAGRFTFDSSGSVEREDLEGFGMIGLIAAADSWEPSRGLKFSTYAYTRIRGAILDELRRMDFLPRSRRERVRALEGALQRLEQEGGTPPTPEELAEELGCTIEEVDEILVTAQSTNHASLDANSGSEAGTEQLGALLSDPRSKDPVGSAEWEETKNELVRAIGELPDQEKTVITLYYAEELLLREISELLGVTESRVSQIHSRALYRLNRSLGTSLGSIEHIDS